MLRSLPTPLLDRRLAASIVVFAHCNCCLQYLIALLEGFPIDSWVVRGALCEPYGVRCLGAGAMYSATFFHTVSQMLAVSYGLVEPRRVIENWTFLTS